MRIAVVFNPISGRGGSAASAAALKTALDAHGHEVALVQSERTAAAEWLDPELRRSALLVIVGGDGAVRMASERAMRWGVPIYQFPLGTENLFAREWGMDRRPETLLGAIARGKFVTVDSGRANGEHFLLMASVGYDAEVVHDLAAHRVGGISRLSYVAPILRRMRSHQLLRLRVTADGERLDDGCPGFVVVANCRQYAMRANLAVHARMDSGHLDILWFPSTGVPDLVGWLLRCQLGMHLDDPRVVYRNAQSITIESEIPFRHQLDGDPSANGDENRLEITLCRKSVRVLAPSIPAPARSTSSAHRPLG